MLLLVTAPVAVAGIVVNGFACPSIVLRLSFSRLLTRSGFVSMLCENLDPPPDEAVAFEPVAIPIDALLLLLLLLPVVVGFDSPPPPVSVDIKLLVIEAAAALSL